MPLQSGQQFARGRLPELDRLVTRTRGQDLAIRTPGYAGNRTRMFALHRSLPERQPKIAGQVGFIYLPASFLLIYWVNGCGQKDWVFFIELWIHDFFPTIAGKSKRSSGHQSGSKMISAGGV